MRTITRLSIGHTPLVRLNRVTKGRVLAKLESRNPSFSVKCRVAANLIWDAKKHGILTKGKEIMEPTSSNTGIVLAFVAAIHYPDHACHHESGAPQAAQGALCQSGADRRAARHERDIAKANEILEYEPGKYVLLQQFENPANPEIHEKTTGPEIWDATDVEVDLFVAGGRYRWHHYRCLLLSEENSGQGGGLCHR